MPDFSLFTDASSLFAKYQISLSENQHRLLDAYAKLMISESKFQNITAVTDYQEIWIRHFLDSAYLLHHIEADVSKVIDIGTGGGIPGIPLAILRRYFLIVLRLLLFYLLFERLQANTN